MRKAIAYGITFLLLCQVVGCGQAPATTTETETEAQTVETFEAVAEENTEETSASEVPEPKVNENGDIEEYEQTEYGLITRYTIKRDGMDQTEEWIAFSSPVVILDNYCVTVSMTNLFCTTTADGWTQLGFYYSVHNKLSDKRMCLLSKEEKVSGQYLDFPYSSGSATISPGETENYVQGSEELQNSKLTVKDLFTLEGTIQCDREKDGSFGGDSDDYPYSLKSALDKLN